MLMPFKYLQRCNSVTLIRNIHFFRGTHYALGSLWENWINNVWNRLDEKRLEFVGAERLVTEWAIRMGGKVQLQGPADSGFWTSGYNTLPWMQDTNQGIKPRVRYKLLQVNLSNTSGVKDTGMQRKFPNLEYDVSKIPFVSQFTDAKTLVD
eukprot:gene4957-6922_t